LKKKVKKLNFNIFYIINNMSLNKTIECCVKINCLIKKNNTIFEKIKKQSIKIKYQHKKEIVDIYIQKITNIINNINLTQEFFEEDINYYDKVLTYLYKLNKNLLNIINCLLCKNIKLNDENLSRENIIIQSIECIINKKMFLRNNKRIIIISNSSNNKFNELINWMISNQITLNIVDIITYENEISPLNIIQKYYNLGYKCFLGNQSSPELSTMINFLTLNKDNLIYFNSNSTSPFYNELTVNNLEVLPTNIIRTAIIDDELCYKLLNEFLYENTLYTLLKLGNNDELAEPLEISGFTNLCYIYQPSAYTTNFLTSLETSNSGLENSFNLIVYEIGETQSLLPQDLIDMLNSNPISNENYKNSEKTLFIINSSKPQSLMNLFNQQSYADNYVLFGDPFFNTELNTNIVWYYSLILMGNYSQMGYKYSKFVDKTQNISSMSLGLVDVLVHFSIIYENKSNLSIPDLLIFLKSIELIKYSEINNKNTWFIVYEMIYHMFNTESITNFNYELLAFENDYNPETLGVLRKKPPSPPSPPLPPSPPSPPLPPQQSFKDKISNRKTLINQNYLIKFFKIKVYYYYEKIFEDKTITFLPGITFIKYMKNIYNIDLYRSPFETYIIKYNTGKCIIKILYQTENKINKLWCASSIKEEFEIILKDTFEIEFKYVVGDSIKNIFETSNKKYDILEQLLIENNIEILFGCNDNYLKILNEWINDNSI